MWYLLLAVLCVLLVCVALDNWRKFQHINRLIRDGAQRDNYLDYVIQKFGLNVKDPYVVRPGFEETRCYHCFYPVWEGHNPDCPWHVLQPLISTLYPPNSRPVKPPQK